MTTDHNDPESPLADADMEGAPRDADDKRPGTDSGSWAQFERRMQLRRENTCLTAMRQALDAGDYDTALARAAELVEIDPSWNEIRLLVEAMRSSEQAPVTTQTFERAHGVSSGIPTPNAASGRARSESAAEMPAFGPHKPLRSDPKPAHIDPDPELAPEPASSAPAQPASEWDSYFYDSPIVARRRISGARLALAILIVALAGLAGFAVTRAVPSLIALWSAPEAPLSDANPPPPTSDTPAPVQPEVEVPNLPILGTEPASQPAATSSSAKTVADGRTQRPTSEQGPAPSQPTARTIAPAAPPPRTSTPTSGTSGAGLTASDDRNSGRKPAADIGNSATQNRQSSASLGEKGRPTEIGPTPPLSQRGRMESDRLGAATSSGAASLGAPGLGNSAGKQQTASPGSGIASATQSTQTPLPGVANVSPTLPVESRPSVSQPPAGVPPPVDRSGSTSPAAGSASPTSTTTRIAPVQPPPAAPSPTPEQEDERAVNAALAAYERGYSTLDASAVRRVWPRVDADALRSAFSQLEAQRISFARCSVDVTGLHATAICRGTATYVPKVGNGDRVSVQRVWQFSLRRFGDGWLIDSAAIR